MQKAVSHCPAIPRGNILRRRGSWKRVADGDGMTVMKFKNQGHWAAWLEKHHAESAGLWLQIARKAAGA
jgi:hypothetical protein